MLSPEKYYQVLKDTTLTSVDLIVRYNGKILLGRRVNEPARGYWFVPGCRTGKGETQKNAIRRVLLSELGLNCNPNAIHVGVFDHIYPNNFLDEKHGTHYVVNAYLVELAVEPTIVHDDQHFQMDWFGPVDLTRGDVHEYTKNYSPFLWTAGT
jgi:colanic acid biosynthesis protein WcaH